MNKAKSFIQVCKRDKSQDILTKDDKDPVEDSEYEEIHKDLIGHKINQENLD